MLFIKYHQCDHWTNMTGMYVKIYFVGTEFSLMVPQLKYSSKLDQYNGCWCPDPLHHQAISGHNIVCNVDIAAFLGGGGGGGGGGGLKPVKCQWLICIFVLIILKWVGKWLNPLPPCASRIMSTVPIHSQVRFTLPVNNEQISVDNPCRVLTAYQQNQCQDQWRDNYQLH